METNISQKIKRWAESFQNKQLDMMSKTELCYVDVPICRNEEEKQLVQDTLIRYGAIPIDKLEVGKTYIGFCRNASEATWRGDKFVYRRTKWGTIYDEEINHFQNDDGFDVFVPIKIKNEN